MRTIWKYKIRSLIELDLPKGAEILSVREQFGEIFMWVLVDSGAEKEKRKFGCFGTGQDIPDLPMKFLGSAQLKNGALVFHVFEIFDN